MRSRTDDIVTKDEVYSCANDWLASALRLEYAGTKCNASILLQVLLIAAARVVSIFAACRDLADAPSDQTIRNALAENEALVLRKAVHTVQKPFAHVVPLDQQDRCFVAGVPADAARAHGTSEKSRDASRRRKKSKEGAALAAPEKGQRTKAKRVPIHAFSGPTPLRLTTTTRHMTVQGLRRRHETRQRRPRRPGCRGR